MKPFKFAYTCAKVPRDQRSELAFIDENMRPISGKTFLKNVSLKELNENLTWGGPYSVKGLLKDIHAVKFYRCTGLETGKWVYICTHSAIDHIFKGPGKAPPI